METKEIIDHPVVSGWYQTLFMVAGSIQPAQEKAFKAADRLTKQIENGVTPDKINMDDVETVFRAVRREFHRVLV